MAEINLSEAEKTFILHGIQDNFRVDGRNREDYRLMVVESNIVTHASGSARLRLANTDVLVGVKAELTNPLPDRPHEGRIQFFVDCSANATPEFEGRGGEDLATEISRCLARAYESSSILDLWPLTIIPGRQCWILYVDILVLECGGNLFDAVSLAVKAALFSTRIPKVYVASIDGGEPEIELNDDLLECSRLDVSNAPCLVTLIKIGNHYVVDPTPEEEACGTATLIVAITEKETLSSVRKGGSGSFHPDTLVTMLQVGQEVGMKLNAALIPKLIEEESLGRKQEKYGFLGI